MIHLPGYDYISNLGAVLKVCQHFSGGGRVCQMLTFDDMRGEGVESRMMTSAMLSLKMQHFRILETFLIHPKFHAFQKCLI